jgi:hypothetical protein
LNFNLGKEKFKIPAFHWSGKSIFCVLRAPQG